MKAAVWFKRWVIVCAVLSFFPFAATAYAGQYDGIWVSSIDPGTLTSIYDDGGGTIVAISLHIADNYYDVYLGTLSGNTATMSSLIAEENAVVRVTFTSLNTASVTIVSCEPASACGLPDGTTFQFNKLF
jgi:hypothetical protein